MTSIIAQKRRSDGAGSECRLAFDMPSAGYALRLVNGGLKMQPGAFSFILQAYYVREWADNFAVRGAAPLKSGFGAEGARVKSPLSNVS